MIGRRQAIAAGAATLLARPALAQKKNPPGVTDTEIKIGQTMPYSGNASAYGVNGRSHAAYFRMINDQGGINGRKINLISLDDGYSPPKTVELARQLVERDQVLFLFAPLGTQCNTAIHKYMNQKKVPQLFVATGASKWGDPKHFPWTMGWQPDYRTEGVIYAKHILQTVKEPKIAILRQNDDMGADYVEGFRETVHGFKGALGGDASKLIVADATYEVTDPTVDSQILQLKNSGANVFYNVTTPKFAAQAIKKAAEIGWKPTHYIVNVAASIGNVIKPAGFDASQGIITAQYVKDATDPRWFTEPDYKEWRAWTEKYSPTAVPGDTTTTTGYAAAFSIVQVLKQCGDDLSRENVMRQAANLHDVHVPMLLPGIKLNTSPTDFYPIDSVMLSRVEGEHWSLFGDLISGRA
ncbi:MAG: ABC transporter substrate-binding protein [Rhodospirillales bacterium]|nr:ABC transporter substrate-binding protein [Rhodospirillales bacterium]